VRCATPNTEIHSTPKSFASVSYSGYITGYIQEVDHGYAIPEAGAEESSPPSQAAQNGPLRGSRVRSLARRLAENDLKATRIRAEINRTIADEQGRKGGILAALRRSPLVGIDLDLRRAFVTGRQVDL